VFQITWSMVRSVSSFTPSVAGTTTATASLSKR
jgi:hypothetical protein